jgi:hypothetical protein
VDIDLTDVVCDCSWAASGCTSSVPSFRDEEPLRRSGPICQSTRRTPAGHHGPESASSDRAIRRRQPVSGLRKGSLNPYRERWREEPNVATILSIKASSQGNGMPVQEPTATVPQQDGNSRKASVARADASGAFAGSQGAISRWGKILLAAKDQFLAKANVLPGSKTIQTKR